MISTTVWIIFSSVGLLALLHGTLPVGPWTSLHFENHWSRRWCRFWPLGGARLLVNRVTPEFSLRREAARQRHNGGGWLRRRITPWSGAETNFIASRRSDRWPKWPAIWTKTENTSGTASRPAACVWTAARARNNCQPLPRLHPSKMAIKLDAKTSKCLNKMLVSGGRAGCQIWRTAALHRRRCTDQPRSGLGRLSKSRGRSRSAKVVSPSLAFLKPNWASCAP